MLRDCPHAVWPSLLQVTTLLGKAEEATTSGTAEAAPSQEHLQQLRQSVTDLGDQVKAAKAVSTYTTLSAAPCISQLFATAFRQDRL